jgi:iron(III) transport system substrate-binding protein
MRSASRVPADALTSYEDLGDPRFRGKLCLRTSNNEYNQSLVADRIAKYGEAETERLLRSWMDNRPRILGSTSTSSRRSPAGRCDVGLTNHYSPRAHLSRATRGIPSLPAWPEPGRRRCAHASSGVGLVKGAEHRATRSR